MQKKVRRVVTVVLFAETEKLKYYIKELTVSQKLNLLVTSSWDYRGASAHVAFKEFESIQELNWATI